MASGVLLDIDGVLMLSWEPLPGAADTIAWLHAHGIEFRLVTNTSSKSRQDIARLLAAAGMRVDATQILTAVTSAAHHLASAYPDRKCFVLNEGDLHEDLVGVQIVAAQSAEVVLLGGAGPSIGYAELDAVFKLARRGVPVVALHRNTRYQTNAGPALDMGAFIVGLEAAAGIEIPIMGKPAAPFFRAALDDLRADPRESMMVGDDIEADVLGAQAIGMTGVLVRTGKFQGSDLRDREQPHHVIDDIGGLPALIGRQETTGRQDTKE